MTSRSAPPNLLVILTITLTVGCASALPHNVVIINALDDNKPLAITCPPNPEARPCLPPQGDPLRCTLIWNGQSARLNALNRGVDDTHRDYYYLVKNAKVYAGMDDRPFVGDGTPDWIDAAYWGPARP
ncbi:hypothetical protein ACET3Z_014764 [Daucus carota]